MQYVGESIIPIHKRMNIHRKGKSGCHRMIEHFSEICKDCTFSIQIIEKLEGNGYKNGARDKQIYKTRLDRENYWIKTLRTVYPYGLNDKVKEGTGDVPAGKLFYPLTRHGVRQPVQTRTKTGGNPNENIDSFVQEILTEDKHERGNFCRKRIESFNRKTLKRLAKEADGKLDSNCDQKLIRWYELIKDYFFTKTFKPKEKKVGKRFKYRIPIFFDNKGLDLIKLSSIINDPDVLGAFTETGNENEIPSVVYKLNQPIRSKLLNYKETVNEINASDSETLGTGIQNCNCADSTFCDPNHGHIITGNLQIIQKYKLRKLISKYPNYREPKTINWRK